jgi:hypothetical protein
MQNGDINSLTEALASVRISENQINPRAENLSMLLSGYFSLSQALNEQRDISPASFINDLQRQISTTKRAIEVMLGRNNMTHAELHQARLILSADGSRDLHQGR